MSDSTVILFTRFGLGQAPAELQQTLADKFLCLLAGSDELPAKLLFYGEGVKLVCADSPVLEPLRILEAKGVEFVICGTCLNYFALTDKVQVGTIGGMPAIIEALSRAEKVLSV